MVDHLQTKSAEMPEFLAPYSELETHGLSANISESVKSTFLEKLRIDLGEILTRHKKQNVPWPEGFSSQSFTLHLARPNPQIVISYARGSTYQITNDWNDSGESSVGVHNYEIFLDGTYGLLLMANASKGWHKGESHPAAIIGLTESERRLTVTQMQGLQSRSLIEFGDTFPPVGIFNESMDRSVVKVADMLLQVAESWAKTLGYQELAVLPADKNFWTTSSGLNGKPHLPTSRGYQIYDLTAQRAGFYRENRDCDWVKSIRAD